MIRRILFVVLLITLFACGGGGGGSSTGGVCSATAYTPNFATASGMTLRKWNHLPIKVFFATTTPIGSTTIEQHLRDGFDKWETALSHDLWTEVVTQGAADLVVTVQGSAPQTTLATTTVFFPSGSAIISSATMTVFTWGSIPEADYNPTGCHEMGHALGIGGHSDSNLDIMYFTGNLSGLLTTRDLNTLRTCYCDFTTSALPVQSATKPTGPMDSQTFVFPAKK
jgi:hypothetical protein